jgi:type IV pilus assembly protein PilB
VRFRVDGVLQEVFALPKKIHSEVISRIKILSGLRTDEHQAAQDGRFRLNIDGQSPLDVRVSIAPTYYGENMVLRLLASKAENFTLESLGFSKENQKKIIKAIKKPYGMILATGPTGSGKTTTLYTILQMLNTPEVAIITIEDPVEYAVEGIEQIGVNPRTGLTFAHGLRSILRQDPNVIMVGEIRDSETAGIAVNVALTGHLLLSTLHTNDPATTLPRLLDMKIESYLVASTVHMAIGQRLVRKICEGCKTEEKMTPAQIKSLSEFIPAAALKKQKVLYTGKGCEACNNTGFIGRIALHEVLVVDEAIKEAILRKGTSTEINNIAKQNGMVTMTQDGLEKAFLGITTIEEVLRVSHE